MCSQVLFLACVAMSATGSSDEEKLGKKLEPSAAVGPGHMTTPVTGNEPNKDNKDKDVSILKQLNKVNDDGSYTYGYEASDGSFKVETRDVAGNVKGMFGFVDETGRLKRVSYSASNSSGFQAAGSTSPPIDSTGGPVPSSPSPSPSPQSIQTIPPRENKDADDDIERDVGKPTVGVKKVLVSKRPISVVEPPERGETTRRRGGNDLRRQLPRNDDDDAPDVYGVHGRSSLQSAPVSPVVSALMSELDPIRAYRPAAIPSARQVVTYDRPAVSQAAAYDTPVVPSLDQQNTISRQAQDDEEPPQYRQVPVQYRQRPAAAGYQQSAYEQPAYQVLPAEPSVYQQQPIVYGPNLVALRDELMELILSFVQARVSQITSVASYRHRPAPQPYPMPYQQPNYYVPSYYQGPRMPVVPGPPAVKQQDDYITQQSSPRVTQTLKDGLIRMLLSTSPRYDPDRNGEPSTPRLTYRRTTQSTPVRNVQIITDDNSNDARPVTTETPD